MNQIQEYPTFSDELRRIYTLSKQGAVELATIESAWLIDEDSFAEKYFQEPDGWFLKKKVAMTANPSESFTLEECIRIADAYEDIAKRLLNHAREIREAKYTGFMDIPEEDKRKWLSFSDVNEMRK